MKDSTASALTGLISLIGAGISLYLTQAHITVKSGQVTEGICNVSATVNCDAAAASSYSEILGIPIAILGLAGYLACAALVGWYLTEKRPRPIRPDTVPGYLQTFFAISVLYSIYLALVSVLVLPAVCPACIGLYVVNIAGLVLTSLWMGQGPVKTLTAQVKNLGKSLFQPAAIGFAAVVAVVTLLGSGYTSAAIERYSEAMARAQKPRKVNESLLYAAHAPAKGPKDAPVKLVVFSDFECPYCSRFAKTLTFAEETFGPKLRVEFRHYPLPFHQFAAMGSAIGACAQRQGMFWEWHDALFADQTRVKPAAMKALMGELGLDQTAINACLDDDAIKGIIEADQEAGRAVGVSGTPSFFVNGTFFNGALSTEELTRVIERELERVAAQADAGSATN